MTKEQLKALERHADEMTLLFWERIEAKDIAEAMYLSAEKNMRLAKAEYLRAKLEFGESDGQ